MKATLEFDLNDADDKMAHIRCVKATDMALVLWEIQMNLNKNMNDRQTAVEWLIEDLTRLGHNFKLYSKEIQQAKEMEKEQIVDAYVECWKANMPDGYECKKSAEQYYNETYGGQDE